MIYFATEQLSKSVQIVDLNETENK